MADLSTLTDEQLLELKSRYSRKKEIEDSNNKISIAGAASTSLAQGAFPGVARGIMAGVGSIAEHIPLKEAWEMAGEFQKEGEKQHPVASAAGTIAGTVAPGGLFGQVTKIAKPLKALGASKFLANVAGTTAAAGTHAALSRAGDPAEKAASEILNSMAENIVAAGAGKAVSLVGQGTFKGGKRLIAGLQNISKDAVDTYASRKKEVLSIIKDKMGMFGPQLAEEASSKIKQVGDALESKLTDVASKYTSSIDMNPVLSTIESEFNKLDRLAFTPQKEQATRAMWNVWSKFQQRMDVGQKFSALDLLELKRDFQRAAEAVYEGQNAGPVQEAFASVAKSAADHLKNIVKDAAPLLKAEQEAIKAKLALGLSGTPDPARVVNILRQTFNPDKVQKGIPEAVRKFDEIYGTSIEDASKLFRSAVQLGKEDVLSGYATGRALMGPVLTGGTPGVGGLAGLVLQSPGTAKAQITTLKQIPKIAEGVAGRLPAYTRGIQEVRRKPLSEMIGNK